MNNTMESLPCWEHLKTFAMITHEMTQDVHLSKSNRESHLPESYVEDEDIRFDKILMLFYECSDLKFREPTCSKRHGRTPELARE